MIIGIIVAFVAAALCILGVIAYKGRGKRKQTISMQWRDSDGNTQIKKHEYTANKKDLPSSKEYKKAKEIVDNDIKNGKLKLGSSLEKMADAAESESPDVVKNSGPTRPSFSKKKIEDKESKRNLPKREVPESLRKAQDDKQDSNS